MEIKLNIWIRYLIPFFLSLFLGTMFYLLAQFQEPPDFEWYAFAWLFFTIFSIWEGAWFISRKLEFYFPWKRGTTKRLLIHLLLSNLLALFIFNGTYIALNWYETRILGSINQLAFIHLAIASAQAFILAQIINSIQIGYLLLDNWQRVRLEAEQYKKQSLVSRLENIRENITPQFLLTNFDQLKNLIHESPDLVDSYLHSIAHQQESLKVTLDSELAGLQEVLKSKETFPLKKTTNPPSEFLDSNRYKQRFLVRSGAKMKVVNSVDIAGFHKDDIVLLITMKGKKFAVDGSLDDLISKLDPQSFFRINRQCIINVQAIQEIRTQGTQLSITAEGSFPKALTVSQRNAAKFKRWLDQELEIK